ncbi:MAG: hypothetical protein PHH28_13955 [Desulfuromonadaceae bacterium]|nr:hypothetical protein [Desulfuromonadaceae bacterium]
MITLSELSIGELAAFVADHLNNKGIDVVLVGGACISIYSENRYSSFDLDFIATGMSSRQKIRSALAEINFVEEQRYFKNPETAYFIEFPSGPLAIGDKPPAKITTLRYSTGLLRLLSPTDSVKDRLAAYYHWKDQQSLEQAILVARDHLVDLDEIQRWSVNEGFAEVFNSIRERLLSSKLAVEAEHAD